MPEGGLVCRKCRSGLCAEGETWCRFCSSAAALSELARTRFTFPAHRGLAEEACYQATRIVRGLVDIDRATNSQVTSLNDRLGNANKRLREVTVEIDKSTAPKALPSRPRESSAVKDEQKTKKGAGSEAADFGSEESYEESEAEEETEPPRKDEEVPPPPPPPARSERPPEPALPPRSEGRGHRDRSRSRHRGRRGGEKHQQAFRALTDHRGFEEPKPKKKRKNRGSRPGGDGRDRRRD